MATLRRARMEDVCALVTDGTHDSPKIQKEGVPFIKGKHISGGTIDFSTCDYITPEDHAEACRRVKPQRGDILFSNIGSVGDTAVVKDDREFSIKNVALFRPNHRLVDQNYFYYLVLSPEFRSNVMNVRSGSAQPFISLANLRSFEVSYVEDIVIQQRIAGILSAYDELIENSQRRIRILESMARALYREWFVHFRFPGHESVPRVPSALGEIPQGWEVRPVESFCPLVTRGVTPKYEAGSGRFIINQKVNRGTELSLDDLKELETALEVPAEKFSRFGDVLVNCLGEGTIGRVHFYTESHHDWAVDQHMSICRAAATSDTIYVYFVMESQEGQGRIASLKTGGTNMTMFNISALRSFPIVAPPKKMLQRFADLALPMLRQKQALTELNRNLRRTRDLLLPRLLSGQIDVEAMSA